MSGPSSGDWRLATGDSGPHNILEDLGIVEPVRLSQLKGAGDTGMWKVECASGLYALRVFPSEQNASCDRETEVMAHARQAGIPLPEVVAQSGPDERPALLLSWISGETLKDAILRRPWKAHHYGRHFGQMQGAINQVPAPSILLSEGRSWLSWKAAGESVPNNEHGDDEPKQLLHLDYHPLNVMLDGDRITGVLDWANAAYGDPRADVARTVTILRLNIGVLSTPRILRLPVLTLIQSFLSGWRQGYEEVAGRLQDLESFYVWAGQVMQRDLAHRYSPAQLQPVRDWTERWQKHR